MIERLGFIGLGVMGEPMCRNLAAKSGLRVRAFDLRAAPLERLAEAGVEPAASVAEVAEGADLVFLSLPHGDAVEAVTLGPGGVLAQAGPGAAVVDLSTSPVPLTRRIGAAMAQAGLAYADAPVARTRAAAEAGTLSIMVGADAELFATLRPFLATMGEEVTHCGALGAGQVVKIMNNMVLFQTVAALAEALAIGRRAGVDGEVLLSTLAKGSADSFALRNHGLKAMLPGRFPAEAFPTAYALKDLRYALDLAADVGISAHGAELMARRFQATIDAGYGERYFPAVLEVIDEV